MQFTYQTPDGETIQVSLSPKNGGGYTARIQDRVYAVEIAHQRPHQLILMINGTRYILSTARQNGVYYLDLEGKTIQLAKPKPIPQGGRGDHVGDLSAAMPGQVTGILVAEGDQVAQGQTLLLLEAMKMELRVKAAYDGRVEAILCAIGDAVERGQALIEVSPLA